MDKEVYICNGAPNQIKALQHDDLGLSDFLQHAKKGEEMAGHKYKSREWKNGGWVYDYGDGRKGSSVNEQRHEQKKEELSDKGVYVNARARDAIAAADDAQWHKNKYEELTKELIELGTTKWQESGYKLSENDAKRQKELRDKDVSGKALMYSNLEEIYREIDRLSDIYYEKYVNPYKKAKAEMNKYSGSSNPQDRMKYQKAAAEYTKCYKDYINATNEFNDFLKERDNSIKNIEAAIKNDGKDGSVTWYYPSAVNKLVYLK